MTMQAAGCVVCPQSAIAESELLMTVKQPECLKEVGRLVMHSLAPHTVNSVSSTNLGKTSLVACILLLLHAVVRGDICCTHSHMLRHGCAC